MNNDTQLLQVFLLTIIWHNVAKTKVDKICSALLMLGYGFAVFLRIYGEFRDP